MLNKWLVMSLLKLTNFSAGQHGQKTGFTHPSSHHSRTETTNSDADQTVRGRRMKLPHVSVDGVDGV